MGDREISKKETKQRRCEGGKKKKHENKFIGCEKSKGVGAG